MENFFFIFGWDLVEYGSALLCFAPILQHEQVVDGQFVNNLLDNWALSHNEDEDLDVFECVVHPKKLWVETSNSVLLQEDRFVALLVEDFFILGWGLVE